MDWIAHANRANALAKRHPSAAEILTFYENLARFLSTHPTEPAVLDWSTNNAKPELAPVIKEAFQLAALAAHEPKVTAPWPNYCPCCGSAPAVALLRQEADGSRRALLCGQCLYEWPYQRILCPNCLEQRFEELPIYIAEDFPHLRVESCSTCNHYLIATDLVKDPQAVPLVEDIAALSLHLWATDHGYTKIRPNLFGF